jgi:hypothetical protein
VRKAKKAALTRKAPRAKKAAKIRAQNARFRANAVKTIEARPANKKRSSLSNTDMASFAAFARSQTWPSMSK